MKYIDHTTEIFSDDNLLNPFVHKHKMFMFESELRALVAKFEWLIEERFDHSTEPGAPIPAGVLVDCDVDTLVDHVVISPDARSWVCDEIQDYVRKEINKEVRQSKLFGGPFF